MNYELINSLAWGTDAGFYRLLPKTVVHPDTETDIINLIQQANNEHRHITWRAAGTSLSGQAISNDILAVVGKKWEKYSILDNGKRIVLQPGIIGQRVNELLAPYRRKFGPDPASIKSAMVGGIISNNASGMSCGIHANSDKMLLSVRIILSDGTILDTGDQHSREKFRQSHPEFIARIEALRDQTRANQALTERIKSKYSIKNVTGLNILPFIEYDDPFDIIAHLMVGSEGTLAFLAEATMTTLPILPYSASALIYFTDTRNACGAVIQLKQNPVSAVELFDYKALCSVKDSVDDFDQLPASTMALLIKVEAETKEELNEQINTINQTIAQFSTLRPHAFTSDPDTVNQYWAIRSGIFPSVGSMRPVGTTCLIEDVAFPIHHLVEATEELQQLLEHHHYDDAVIYGHALEGNYHFIINQRFDTQDEINRYEALMNDVAHLVVDHYDGSLKAEHGTGRNMAPFVEREWGKEAFQLMKEVKQLFDPNNIFNPGVIFNDDPKCHISNLKPLPQCHPLIDRCIECGFCEVNCVTCGFALSSRQRIVVQREISRLQQTHEDDARLNQLIKEFQYLGNTTCAGDGLCSTSCPIKINTGELIHVIREREINQSRMAQSIGTFAANHLSGIETTLGIGLRLVSAAHWLLGDKLMSSIAKGLHYGTGQLIPLWTPAMPRATRRPKTNSKPTHPTSITSEASQNNSKLSTLNSQLSRVVYFPSCINQTMGTAKHDPDQTPLMQKTVQLLEKAGYEVIFPENMSKLCCGTIWESKGMPELADQKSAELERALLKASDYGMYPVLCDQSPCLYRMRHTIKGVDMYEPVEFILKFVADRLNFTPINDTITVHTTCSTTKMGLKSDLIRLAEMCSTSVVVPQEVGCCGFAGDKGFFNPEVNEWALRKLRPQIEKHGITVGYSNSRTCEIGLTTHSGVPFQNIIYLVDKVTSPK
ncbi:MAG: FAD-binding oxidoreductase [Paludibacteraceae bacterium]|nr:FAD-binding oxidoreductase [Paludibacteraceae bacterium]